MGVAALPKGAVLAIAKNMKLRWRPLLDSWAQRKLLVATGASQPDNDVSAFMAFLLEPSFLSLRKTRMLQS
jgi:hypothetical protein